MLTAMPQRALNTKMRSFEIGNLLCVCKPHIEWAEQMKLESIYLHKRVRTI